jgi:hypothetical protein
LRLSPRGSGCIMLLFIQILRFSYGPCR